MLAVKNVNLNQAKWTYFFLEVLKWNWWYKKFLNEKILNYMIPMQTAV